MVSTKEKYECPVCGEMISKQGVAGHNNSKKHLAALELQKQDTQRETKQDVQQTKPVPTITTKPEIKQEVKQIKIESIKTTKPQQVKQEVKEEGYDGLKWD